MWPPAGRGWLDRPTRDEATEARNHGAILIALPHTRSVVVPLSHLRVSLLLGRLLDTKRTVYLAAAITLGLGLFFLFVWSPLPWGWLGIDHYDDRARRLAAGQPFDTTDVPWGYAYYLAFFYAIFGPRPGAVMAMNAPCGPLFRRISAERTHFSVSTIELWLAFPCELMTPLFCAFAGPQPHPDFIEFFP